MRINETNRIGAINSYQRTNENNQAEEKKSRRKDEVSISREGMQMLQETNNTDRAQRISELKRQVSTGTYHVETGKLVEKLAPYFRSMVSDASEDNK
ncbi:flagellar biosynthesis anti-sigma factor FlgM [Paenibacillus sp. CAA11]|uniref:flagellar biosynthesis anti-sigma factor FlgM n=1 Tax=Paenibacillus sp. CAA11 TaxID=1532905 RepID=UPI000D3A92B9|nr:flagellar biosynthesis anti-sigma factor FlgM [Paenibacillus sp. CAA11]AWB46239.1 flagellar biosynthesis anti-sigma factor FlgM [Paenibacillus sp. CAA11]